jgi:hypothetical protein
MVVTPKRKGRMTVLLRMERDTASPQVAATVPVSVVEEKEEEEEGS